MRKLPLGLLLTAVVTLSACGDANPLAPSSTSTLVQAGTCAYPSDGDPAKPVDPPKTTDVPNSGTVTATVHMTAGDIEITMDRAKSPCTVNSFVSLAQQGFFDNTVCHRLVDTGIFILQCGDPTATGRGGPGYTIPDEWRPPVADGAQVAVYPPGSVAMAKLTAPNTGGSQFFLVFADTPLPPDYTIFGTMDAKGLDVVGGIAAQGVAAEDGQSPIAEAKITSVTLG